LTIFIPSVETGSALLEVPEEVRGRWELEGKVGEGSVVREIPRYVCLLALEGFAPAICIFLGSGLTYGPVG
jgi:hypothetical protein